jgi:hypothetical protein
VSELAFFALALLVKTGRQLGFFCVYDICAFNYDKCEYFDAVPSGITFYGFKISRSAALTLRACALLRCMWVYNFTISTFRHVKFLIANITVRRELNVYFSNIVCGEQF